MRLYVVLGRKAGDKAAIGRTARRKSPGLGRCIRLIGACFLPIKRVLLRLNDTVQARSWHQTDPAVVTAIIVLGSRPSSSQTRSRGPAYFRSFASGVWSSSVTTCGCGDRRCPSPSASLMLRLPPPPAGAEPRQTSAVPKAAAHRPAPRITPFSAARKNDVSGPAPSGR